MTNLSHLFLNTFNVLINYQSRQLFQFETQIIIGLIGVESRSINRPS